MFGELFRVLVTALLPKRATIWEYLMFPPRNTTEAAATTLFGVRPSATRQFDVTKPADMAQAQMGHDPLTNEFLSGLNGGRRDG